jgi:hypothetical protein
MSCRRSAVLLFLLLCSNSIAETPDLSPSPALSANQVVLFQLEALHDNDLPTENAGIAKVFRFASPANRAATGPLEHFTEIVKSPAYAALLHSRTFEISFSKVEAQRAEVLVKVTSQSGTDARFEFILSRQTEGDFRNCWMTDSVLQVGPPEPAPPVETLQA